MKKILLAIISIFSCFVAIAQTTVTLNTVNKKDISSVSIVELKEESENVFRLKIPASQIATDTKYIDVIHPNAFAMKGDAGYFVYPRGSLIKFEKDDGVFARSKLIMPLFGAKTPNGTFVAIAKGMAFEMEVRTEVSNGIYKIFPRFHIERSGFGAYEDIILDFYVLKGDNANYSGMARTYRNYQLERGAVKPINKRIKKQPKLEYLAKCVEIRLQSHASKPWNSKKNPPTIEDQTPENEPKVSPNPYLTYRKSAEFAQKLKNAGVNEIDFCSVGWNIAGHDGRYPQIFPVEPSAGTEEEFKMFIEHVKTLGFQIAPHINYTDAYKVANIWSDDLICKDPKGKMTRNAVWCGGRAYNLCAKSAWKKFIPDQLEQLSKYDFNGALYIDVLSAIYAYPCHDPKHPATYAEQSKYYNKILKRSKKLFGLAASECGFDHVAGNIDYINYVGHEIRAFENGHAHKLVSRIIPMFQLVYNGIILSNPDRFTQNHTRGKDHARQSLKLVEFGGRPIFYSGGHEEDIAFIKEAYNEFLPVRHLQREFMDFHDELAPDVFITRYSSGTEIVCNYAKKPFSYKGKNIAPMKYEIYKP